MKKKILSILICALIIASLLSLPVFAEVGERSLSEDYKTLIFYGEKYVRVDTYHIYLPDYLSYTFNMPLSITQSHEIEYIDCYEYDCFLELNITYKKGGFETYYYIAEKDLEDYKKFLSSTGAFFEIEDNYRGTSFSADSSELLNNPITVNGYEVKYYSSYIPVTSYSADLRFAKQSGYILTDNQGGYFYLDEYQFGYEEAKGFNALDYDTVTLYEINDPDILAKLNSDQSFEDPTPSDEIGRIVMGFMLVILLGIAPLAGLIICLVFSTKAKPPYRKLLLIIAWILIAEILVFAATAVSVLLIV